MAKHIVFAYGNVEDYVPLEAKHYLELSIQECILIGVVGISGAGKTDLIQRLCAHFIKEQWSSTLRTINLDEIGHDIYESQENPYCIDVKRKMQMYFGDCVVDDELMVDRKALADIVFNDRQALDVLNELMKNPIRHAIYKKIKKSKEMEGKPVIFLIEGAIIPEHGLLPFVNNNVINVICDANIALERIKKRDNLTEEQAYNRAHSQREASIKTRIIQESITRHKFGNLIEVNTTNGITEEELAKVYKHEIFTSSI